MRVEETQPLGEIQETEQRRADPIQTTMRPKRGQNFIENRTCDRCGLAPLTKDDLTNVNNLTKNKFFNDQFSSSSVFTKGNTYNRICLSSIRVPFGFSNQL